MLFYFTLCPLLMYIDMCLFSDLVRSSVCTSLHRDMYTDCIHMCNFRTLLILGYITYVDHYTYGLLFVYFQVRNYVPLEELTVP